MNAKIVLIQTNISNKEESEEKGNIYVMKVMGSRFPSLVFWEGGQKLFNFGIQENLVSSRTIYSH